MLNQGGDGMSSLIKLEIINNHLAIITLNRPESANALSNKMLNQLNDVIQRIDADESIYCTIITGAGNKAFCAGADLKERKNMSDEEVKAAVRYIGNTIQKIEQVKMPVIAAINGAAFGGGLELALACDFRYASKEIFVGLTETSLAIIPGAGGTQRLSRLIGMGQAKRLIYTAKRITAEEAFSIGLVEMITDSNNLLEKAIKTATTIIENGPIALQQAKYAINNGIDVQLEEGLEIEYECYKQTIQTNDRLEGLKAFAEKRKPIYKNN